MSFADLHLKPEYTTGSDNFLRDFFVPVLKEALTYDRAVGYFSSSALVGLSKGLYGFAERGGRIRVLTSPHLSAEDFESIQKGYEERKVVMERALLSGLKELKDLGEAEKDRLAYLANLIAQGVLDIRIAFRKKGLYHEKIGILKDADGRRIAFTGSANETGSALYDNYETISVFCDWRGEEKRVVLKADHFERLWNNQDPEIQVECSEKLSTAIIEKYFRVGGNPNRDELELASTQPVLPKPIPGIPSGIALRDYQVEAIRKFLNADGQGIFDMATGTGKTFTALGAICALNAKSVESGKGALGVIIVAPMTYLVEQWAEDIRKFGIEPIIAYSNPKYHKWQSDLTTAILLHSLKKKFFCVITTNNTFAGEKMQMKFKNLKREFSNLLLVVDEAHNFGAMGKQKVLSDLFKYRLALSATLVRHNDKEGTDALLSFFGERCIEYSLAQAIKDKFLTPYDYHPVIVTFTEEERRAYADISAEIAKHFSSNEDGQLVPDSYAEMLMVRRARIVATASEKIEALRKAIEPHQDDRGILVYCGTSGRITELDDYIPIERVISEDEDKEYSQIDVVTRMLNAMDMKTVQYTSKVSVEERLRIIDQFRNDNIQVLAAIKCLDEGVSIPSIRYAFILASTTNPKEYIQRRGRVLRLWKGKEKAVIYDFITLPDSIGNESLTAKCFRSLAEKEMRRYYEFNRLALNKDVNEMDFLRVMHQYRLNPEDIQQGVEK